MISKIIGLFLLVGSWIKFEEDAYSVALGMFLVGLWLIKPDPYNPERQRKHKESRGYYENEKPKKFKIPRDENGKRLWEPPRVDYNKRDKNDQRGWYNELNNKDEDDEE